jgi:hypothetical protein
MEQIFLTQEELQKIKDFQIQNDNLTVKFGALEFQIQNLLLNKQNIVKELEDLRVTQNTFSIELQSKYGEGSINIETGEFTKTNF